MPLGLLRLNERQQRPNAHINFIKPLASSSERDQEIAKDFLERIAAQCYPIMKQHYISVMSLEEHAPNPEFLGRNFNAGEVIQLVLKDKQGRWLSFQFVQMVMMHELAHCKQMNHSRFFWKERNVYADAMKELWQKGYKGEGLWGRGLDLTSGQLVLDRMPENADIPEHLCGGTYRRARGRKRKRGQQDDESSEKPRVSYAERQQRRIAKKFGKHGEGSAVGEDELVRGALEKKRHYGKPKVANSKRGRELRASAALARFEATKKQPEPETTPELEDDEGSELEDWSDEDVDSPFAIASDDEETVKIKNEEGEDMVQVCGDEEDDDGGGQDEMEELQLMRGKQVVPKSKLVKAPAFAKAAGDDSETESEPDDTNDPSPKRQDKSGPDVAPISSTSTPGTSNTAQKVDSIFVEPGANSPHSKASNLPPVDHPPPSNMLTCQICSLENNPEAPTCLACSHVLKTSLMPNHWRCKSEACTGSKYINAGDAGRCGLCGAQKPAVETKAMGVLSPDVLRWD